MINRRELLLNTATLAGAAQSGMAQGSGPKNIVISSANGLAACAKAMEVLKAGGDTLDAVIAGVNIVELDPEDTSVGYGGLPNEEGVVELDASVMHGPTRRCGSVAAIQNVKAPSKVAKLVMEHTAHVMLVGEGAWRFAKAWGYPKEDLLTEKSRLAWMVWKQSMRDPSGRSNWVGQGDPAPKKPTAELRRMFPNVDEETLEWAWKVAVRPPTGTINCLSLNSKGEMSGTTTTSGLAWKIPGRVGDSPIIGAGLFVDQEVGGAGSTGVGEENIKISGAHTIVENMRHGMPPKEACLDALKRFARNYNNDRTRLAALDLNFYALRKDGAYGSATLWQGRQRGANFAVNDGGASRHEPCAWLLER
jgi:N4-(beta-N-acetylglucosaminyl)-L-asparaginase